jgi:hypothetical protein
MGELESLLLVLVAIYFSECLVWLRRGAVLFFAPWSRDWKWTQPGRLLGNQNGGFQLANPLPPLGRLLISLPFPLSLSSQGAGSWSSITLNSHGRPQQCGVFLTFEAMQEITREAKGVRVNGAMFFRAASISQARQVAALLRELKKLPENKREAAIQRRFREMLDTAAVLTRWKQCEQAFHRLALIGNSLFFSLFLLAPALVMSVGLRRCWPFLVAGLLTQTIAQAIFFRRAHQALFPDGAEERFAPFLTMLLSPPAAIRAHDQLTRHLAEGFHPLAVARAFCPPEPFQELARRVWRDLNYPLLPVCPSDRGNFVAAEQWTRTAWRDAVEEFLRRESVQPDTLLPAPAPTEPANQSYCPRCGAQFVVAETFCTDCGGWPVKRFTPEAVK